MSELLYGRNAVRETLRAQRRSGKRLWVAEGTAEGEAAAGDTLREIVHLAEAQQIPMETVARRMLDRELSSVNHQGVALETSGYPYVDLADCLNVAARRNEAPFLLVLDHIQDPQNVGTLLRTADAVGVHGVVLPGRRTATITPAVVNTSSGATEHLSITTGNISQHIQQLQRNGVWVVGVEQDARAYVFDQFTLPEPLALVLGAEGSGLARLTRERCDALVHLPMGGHIESLNVAVTGSIVLYHAWRERKNHE